jgi:hypothetical protein
MSIFHAELKGKSTPWVEVDENGITLDLQFHYTFIVESTSSTQNPKTPSKKWHL